MSLISENVIPHDYGKVFTTDAQEDKVLEVIKTRIMTIDGIRDVEIKRDVFPREFIVYTSKLVKVIDIEKVVAELKYHAIPKDLFKL